METALLQVCIHVMMEGEGRSVQQQKSLHTTLFFTKDNQDDKVRYF